MQNIIVHMHNIKTVFKSLVQNNVSSMYLNDKQDMQWYKQQLCDAKSLNNKNNIKIHALPAESVKLKEIYCLLVKSQKHDMGIF